MIPFFRKIRKKMADDNKPIKYMRYAIGEIVLVVIGILIALQINNWNEKRKNNATQIKYLEGLFLNIEEDIEALNFNHSMVYKKMKSITYISNRFYEENETKNDSLLIDHILNMWSVELYSNQSFVFDGIKTSGKLNLISSDDLLFNILDYYHQSTEIIKKQEIHNTNINQLLLEPNFSNKIEMNSIIEPRFDEYLRSKVGDFDASFFSQDPESSEVKNFRNTLSGIKGLLAFNLSLLSNLRVKARTLKADLESYLKSKKSIGPTFGQPHILVYGKATYHEIEIQDGNRFDNWIEMSTNQININYPKNMGYGVIRFVDLKVKRLEAKSADYSIYNSISLDLKGEVGGELISIAFLDTDDLGDGSETRVSLNLNDQWKTYEIDLDKFQATNFKSLIESPVIVLQNEALSFSIKNIEFKE